MITALNIDKFEDKLKDRLKKKLLKNDTFYIEESVNSLVMDIMDDLIDSSESPENITTKDFN